MRKVLAVVEDPRLLDTLKNFFEYSGISYKIFSTASRKFKIERNEIVLLDVRKGVRRLPKLILNVQAQFPNLKMICLISRKDSEIKNVLGERPGQIFFKTQDLMRIYKKIKQLSEDSKSKEILEGNA